MIVNFHIQNFGSIKNRQTLSFEADKSKHLEEYYIIPAPGGKRLLKLALIYGANASGKTSILKALDFLMKLVMQPAEKKTDTLKFEPFLFDSHTPQQPTVLGIEFIQKETVYSYEVEFTKQSVLSEELKQLSPGKRTIFKRETDTENQFTIIKKLTATKAAKEALEANTLWNNTVLGGFLKTNVQIEELKDVSNWFGSYVKPIILPDTDITMYVTNRIESSDDLKKDVLNILQKADFNISGIKIKTKEVKSVPENVVNILRSRTEATEEELNGLISEGKLKVTTIELQHSVLGESYLMHLFDESQGTQRYYGFAGLLTLLMRETIAIPIDELESSLHPDLYMHFLLSFLSNSKSSQLIATTHNRELMNDRDLFRDDAIWFTQKGEEAATELYSLADFDSTVVRDTSNVLNAYKAGKLGAVPNLGDYHIDLSHEKK